MRTRLLLAGIAVIVVGALLWALPFLARAPRTQTLSQEPIEMTTGDAAAESMPDSEVPTAPEQQQPTAEETKPSPLLSEPLSDSLARVTKKPFGLRVTQKDSPVQPERFAGYHCGVDFETTPEEQTTDVVVRAVCDGTLLSKRTATGYGGIAVQSCELNGEKVTVVYGHLRLSSITARVGDAFSRGQFVGVLGTGFSRETDGERKHLHLGIHKGAGSTVAGYVQTKAALAEWIDAVPLLK